MSRLAPFEKLLVLFLVPLWVLCLGLSLKAALRQTAYPSAIVESGAGGYPEVVTFRPWFEVERFLLREGDRLIRVGDTDLGGVGPFAWAVRIAEESSAARSLEVEFERGGRRQTTRMELGSYALYIWPWLPVSVSGMLAGLLILFRGRGSRAARDLGWVGVVGGILGASYFVGTRAETALAYVASVTSIAVGGPLFVRCLLRLPDDELPTGPWLRRAPWLLVVVGPLATSGVFGIPPAVLPLGPGVGTFLVVTATLTAGAWSYRRADVLRRRQLKWLIFGLWIGLLPVLIGLLALLYDHALTPVVIVCGSALSLIPICGLVAVTRYNLFDIDRLLSATATYNLLLIVLLGAGLVIVPRVAEAASGVLGIDPGTSQVVLSLLLAGIVVPAQRRLRPQIDRLFFKERYAVDHGIAELLPVLVRCSDATELTRLVGGGLQRLLRPETCVVYARAGEGYAPVFVEGPAVPPAFDPESPLIRTLVEKHRPLALDGHGRRSDEASLGPFDRAALETLGAAVLVPVRLDDILTAFLCLGAKRSGDVYTSTDLSLLAAVAETVAQKLRHFDQDALLREGRAMQESLRRYVPGAIVEQLADGADLEPAEREVSVLFVDIRGYTSFAESRRAEEIFTTVNRYTETVSEIVRAHGGAVVEFNGDGMMAVFGAPRELDRKERAAVEAGREIVTSVGALRLEDAEGRLTVGVGVATGPAFVGNIQAVDRLIWSAIGNTTNLAARLQSLTRDLDAALAIDPPTRERAGPAGAGFEERPGLVIRGRQQRQDVHVLPLSALV